MDEPAATSSSENRQDHLLEQFRGGDSQALGALLRFHQARVYSLVVRFVGNQSDAEELTQETFLQAFKSMHRFQRSRSFRSWLFGIAVNVCRNHLRSTSRREVPKRVDDSIQPLWSQPPTDPEAAIVASTNVQRLEGVLSGLGERDRVLFLLRYGEGMSYRELGQIFHLPRGLLRVRCHRIVKRLRTLLKEVAQ